MTTAASTTTFAVVFALFVASAGVLIVLTLRFLIRQAKASRAAWTAGQQDADGEESTDEDLEREKEFRAVEPGREGVERRVGDGEVEPE